MLTERFLEEEVKGAVWDCENSKCPGPDGFNFRFIKEFWETMKGDICRFVNELHQNGRLPKGSNSAFISLIPKKENPQHLGDFRPISLVGCMYKILAKILARRLNRVLPYVIDDRQSAFIRGRNILHSVLVVNETLDEVKRKKKGGIFLKVDFEKAYDSVSWNYILYMLQRMGFCSQWVKWIAECLRSARASVLVNGSPLEEFPLQKGLRQGDPLAPFLFVIAAEGLTAMMREAERKNIFKALEVGQNKVKISIVQYADDTMFFGKDVLQNVVVIKAMLRSFELISGLKVNFCKSKFGAVGVDDSDQERYDDLLNCRLLKLPFSYLGLPIRANPRRRNTWMPVLEKLRKRLSS